MFEFLRGLGVDGHMLSPAYSYLAVQTKEIFMSRQEIQEKFRLASRLLEQYSLMTSPIYLEFLRGERDLMCTAWGNPTYNPRGWKGPCYLITDKHHATFKEFMETLRGKSTGAGAIHDASIAWFTSAMNPPRCWDQTAPCPIPGDC